MKSATSGIHLLFSKFASPVALTVMFATVTVGGAGVWYGVSSSQRAYRESVPIVQGASASVEFFGGELGFEQLNPKSATVVSSSERGELDVLNWTISPIASRSPLLSGEGADAGKGLDALLSEGPDGEYDLVFTLKDAFGGEYELSRSLYILADPSGAVIDSGIPDGSFEDAPGSGDPGSD